MEPGGVRRPNKAQNCDGVAQVFEGNERSPVLNNDDRLSGAAFVLVV